MQWKTRAKDIIYSRTYSEDLEQHIPHKSPEASCFKCARMNSCDRKRIRNCKCDGFELEKIFEGKKG